MPKLVLPFTPLRQQMYSREELFAGYDADDPESYANTVDFSIYRHYVVNGKYAPGDYTIAMMQALHDNAITQALSDHLASTASKSVAVMGGHELPRDSVPYRAVAEIARELTRQGFTLLSGGGPGAMEATHLGAACADAGPGTLEKALQRLEKPSTLPELSKIIRPDGKPDKTVVASAHAWFRPAFELATELSRPQSSVAIPTWLYGHEPTSPFATHVGKYFQNSIREDGLLAIATHGVVYVEGRAGTCQEIFQDAAQNYYRTFGSISPMVFLGVEQWEKKLPVLPLLRALLTRDDFEQYVLVTDEIGSVIDFIRAHEARETPNERMTRHLQHKS